MCTATPLLQALHMCWRTYYTLHKSRRITKSIEMLMQQEAQDRQRDKRQRESETGRIFVYIWKIYACACVWGTGGVMGKEGIRHETVAQNVLQTNCQVFLWLTSWLVLVCPCSHFPLSPLSPFTCSLELQKVHSETPRGHLPRHSVGFGWHSWAQLPCPDRSAARRCRFCQSNWLLACA